MLMDDGSFRKILNFFDLSWSGYRRVRKGVKKRLVRHMQQFGAGKVEDYLLLLKGDSKAEKEARRCLTVSISRFFRDLRLWEVLEESILPELARASGAPGLGPIRAWSAGCSCGEEAYSLKILWDRLAKRLFAVPSIEILGTDTNPEVLQRAVAGVYPQSSMRNVSPSILEACFTPVPGGFAVREGLKEGIHWAIHDFISAPPPGDVFDLIFLRNNLLTYYEPPAGVDAFLRIAGALRAEGYLIIGNNEGILLAEVPLERCPQYRSIYRYTRQEPIS
jgi:chemotaxis methyl-accepting protein methylase